MTVARASTAPAKPAASRTGYSKKQLEELWVKAGGASALAATMAAVGLAESGGGAQPYGDVGLGGTGPTSFGIWQIHTPAHPQYNSAELVSNPLYNAKAAVAISGNSTAGLGNWTTYKTGAYKSFLGGGGESLVEGVGNLLLDPGYGLKALKGENPSAGTPAAGLGNPLSWGEKLAGFVEGGGLGKMVLNGALVAVGLVLIVVGIYTFAKPAGGARPVPVPVPV